MLKSSPFEGVHSQLGANFRDYDGWSLPADFGDVEMESKALAEHCAAVDLCSFGRIMLKGGQAKEALEAVFEAKSGRFLVDRWVWARMKAGEEDILCRVARLNGDFMLLTPPGKGEAVMQKLESVSNGSVSITDITDKTAMLGLYGPAAFESVCSVLPFSIDHMEPGDAAKMSVFMISFTLLRGSWTGGEGLELICPAAAGPMAAGAVAKYRHKHNITPAGMESLRGAMAKMNPPV